MPTLETADGKPVDVTPPDPAAINAKFQQAMNDDGPDPAAPPRRAPRDPAATAAARPRTSAKPKAEKSRVTTTSAAAPLSDKQRAEGVTGWAQLGAMVPLVLARATEKNAKDPKDPKVKAKADAYKADAATIAGHAEELADACVQVAAVDPKFAAALDRVCGIGPYGALIGVAFGIGSQVLRNHRPERKIPGTVHPDELLRADDVPAAA